MARYISLPIEVNPNDLLDEARARLQALVPGWEPSDGNLDDILLRVVTALAATQREMIRDVPEEIFRYFIQEVLLVQPKLATYASFSATWTAIDDSGWIIPAGALVGVRRPDGELEPFRAAQEYSIPPGDTSIADVFMTAVDAGSQASGLATTADRIEVMDALAWVDTVVGDGITSGGEDGETTDEYMDRGVEEVRLMSPRPITDVDFAIVARRIGGVDRAYYLNLYKADTFEDDVDKAITIVVTDENGEALSAGVMNEVLALLQSLREINMLIYVRAPQYQDVAIAYEVTALPGVDVTELEATIDATIAEEISPKRWGELQFGTEEVGSWRPVNVVRYLEVATVINNVPGVDFIEVLTLDAGTTDVTLDPAGGIPVVLPRATPIVGIVNEAP